MDTQIKKYKITIQEVVEVEREGYSKTDYAEKVTPVYCQYVENIHISNIIEAVLQAEFPSPTYHLVNGHTD